MKLHSQNPGSLKYKFAYATILKVNITVPMIHMVHQVRPIFRQQGEDSNSDN